MKKTLLSIFAFLALGLGYEGNAQRYTSEIFTSYERTNDVNFGFNVDFLRSDFSNPAEFIPELSTLTELIEDGETVPLNWFQSNADIENTSLHTSIKLMPLRMDIYTPPAEDTETSRPVIMVAHTGNFLPPLFNGGISGSKNDSSIVNLCRQFAKRGYVAAAVAYRGGWNPLSTNPDIRRGTLLQAVYRAIHDMQSSVRFMRASVAQGNPYGIDPTKIVLYGQGTGGYVVLAYATLNDYETEIAGLDKFIGEDGNPYVVEETHGGLTGAPGLLRLPDPLFSAGISKDVSMVVNAGGALADISWLNAGEAAMVSFHAVRDPFAPFGEGTVVVPTTNENVVDVSGANTFIPVANELGNNDLFADLPGDPFTDVARGLYGVTMDNIYDDPATVTISEDAEGLFPIVRPINTLGGNVFTNESGPWEWWDFATLQAVVAGTNAATGQDFNATQLHQQGLAGNPGMGPEKGLAYLDTIMGYLNPRIVAQLDLPVSISAVAPEIFEGINVFPNPGKGVVNITSERSNIDMVKIFNFAGKLVKTVTVNGVNTTIDISDLADGVYILQGHVGADLWHKKYIKQ
jgi:acetyl esterase/lipase